MRLAGIDIGTLTCRLLIANMEVNRKLTPILSDRKILRLGEGVDRQRRLNTRAIDRVVQAGREWRKRIDEEKVEAFTAVATSAVRDAANREDFLARMVQEAGLEVEIIDGEEEARRTLLGIQSGLSKGISDILAVDIGGGSTEFILSHHGMKPKSVSMEMGVVRVTERFFHDDPPTEEQVQQARQFVLELTCQALSRLGDLHPVQFIGTAGTITTLSAMAQGLVTYDPERIHNSILPFSTIQDLEHDLFFRTTAQRKGLPGLEPGREEVIPAGVLLLRSIMECLGFSSCLVSEYGLREGVLVDLAQRRGFKPA